MRRIVLFMKLNFGCNEESLEENLRRGFHALAVARSIYYKESEKLSED